LYKASEKLIKELKLPKGEQFEFRFEGRRISDDSTNLAYLESSHSRLIDVISGGLITYVILG